MPSQAVSPGHGGSAREVGASAREVGGSAREAAAEQRGGDGGRRGRSGRPPRLLIQRVAGGWQKRTRLARAARGQLCHRWGRRVRPYRAAIRGV